MAYFYEGYYEARQKLLAASIEECLSTCDALFGRDGIEDESDLEEVRDEALRQLKEVCTDKSSREYETAQFFIKVGKAVAH